MRSDRVLRLFEDSQARLWVSTEDGLIQFNQGVCTLHGFNEVAKSASALIVREDALGNVWASVYDVPYRFENNRFVEVAVEINPWVLEQALADSNGIWMAYSSQLLRTLGKRIVLVKELTKELSDNIIDAVEYPVRSGIVYIGTSGNGLFRYENEQISRVSITQREHSQFIWKLHVDKNNQLWALNFYGLSLFNGTSFVEYEPYIGVDDVAIVSVYDDSEGNLWLGSTNQGLYQLRQSIITMIDRDQGLQTEQMLSLTLTPDGRILFATNCGGIYEWKDGRAIPSPINRFLPNQCVWSIFADSKGRYWIGSRTLYQTNSLDARGVELDRSTDFPVSDVNAITEDRSGNMWFGSLYGAVRYDGTRYRVFTKQEGLSNNDARVFYEDRAGRMWVGTAQGVNLIEGDQATVIHLAQGPNSLIEPYVRAIHEDVDGVMWFGTYGNGIYRWDNGKVTNIRKEHGLFDNIVSHLIEDESGEFWSGSNSGIFRTSRAMLNEFSKGHIRRVKSEFYGLRDGMNSAETNGGFQPNVIRDAAGNLYFPTVMGVAMVSTRDATSIERIPPVFITAIRSDLNDFPLNGIVEISHNTAFLEIEYTALNYRDAGKLQFRYQLQGLEDTWIDVGSRRVALFTKLPPGEYVFKVSASVDGAIWNEIGASISIIVVPPFWGTTWFQVMIAGIFLVSGPSVFVWRVNALKAEQEKKRRYTEQLIESQENERRRIAAELHDGLGQQILVIKNRAEMAQQTVTDQDQTSHHLKEIMQSAMSSISDVRSITHDLRPVHLERFGLTDSLNTLCEDVRQTAKMQCDYQIDDIDDLIPKERQIHFYRVIQEGLTNIQKHSKAEHASVFVQRTETGVRAMLWDDGIGFDVRAAHPTDGLGLSGMQERMQTLGGTIQLQSSPEEGTTLTLTIPNSTHA
jgi:signal transduction histidine kinase/ligand-binding sensor domain-containing protein